MTTDDNWVRWTNKAITLVRHHICSDVEAPEIFFQQMQAKALMVPKDSLKLISLKCASIRLLAYLLCLVFLSRLNTVASHNNKKEASPIL